MAKVIQPLNSQSAAGTFGKIFVYSGKTGGQTSVTVKTGRPINRTRIDYVLTKSQVYYNIILASWQAMSPLEKLLWFRIWTTASNLAELHANSWDAYFKYCYDSMYQKLGLVLALFFPYQVRPTFPDYSEFANDMALGPSYPDNVPEIIQSIRPQLGGSLLFSGAGEYGIISPSYSLVFSSVFSFSIMFTPNSLDHNQYLFCQALNGISIALKSDGEIWVGDQDGHGYSSNGMNINTAGYYIVDITYDGTTLKFYRQGVLFNQGNANLIIASASSAYIGKRGTNNDGNFNGILTFIFAFKRVRSAKEIANAWRWATG